jgi:hypothetical protein
MRHLKITMIMAAALVLTVLLGLAGCGEDRGHRIRSDQDRSPRYQHQDNDRRN